MTDTRWLDPEQQRAWRSYLFGAQRVTEALNRQLEDDAGVSLSEYELLVRLSEAPDHTVRMSELAAQIMHSRSRVTHTVARMERRGLVRREACADDRRGVNCVMTEAGWDLLVAAAPGHVEAVRHNLVDLLTPEDFHTLGRIMTTVLDGPDAEGAAERARAGRPVQRDNHCRSSPGAVHWRSADHRRRVPRAQRLNRPLRDHLHDHTDDHER